MRRGGGEPEKINVDWKDLKTGDVIVKVLA